MKGIIWKIKFLWYKYILRHKYTIGFDMGTEDLSCWVVTRQDKKRN